MPGTWEHGLTQMSAGCAFSSSPQVVHFSLALRGHISYQEAGDPAVSRKCPGLSVVGESKEAEVLVLRGELVANDGRGTNRST